MLFLCVHGGLGLHRAACPFLAVRVLQQVLDAVAGSDSTPMAPNLDALWAKLQQQHSQEAEAARLNRRANSGALPAGSQSKANSSSAEAEQGVVQQGSGKETISRTGGRVNAVNDRPVSQLPTPAREQQMSEADFWKMMQK